MNTYQTLDLAAFRLQMIAAHIAPQYRLEAQELRKHAQALYRLIDDTCDRIHAAQENQAELSEAVYVSFPTP